MEYILELLQNLLLPAMVSETSAVLPYIFPTIVVSFFLCMVGIVLVRLIAKLL